jgi:hypothetical protein
MSDVWGTKGRFQKSLGALGLKGPEPMYQTIYLPTYLSIYLPIYIYLSVYMSIFLSVCLSIYLSNSMMFM